MTLQELKDSLDGYLKLDPRNRNLKVMVPYKSPHAIGGTPAVEVDMAHKGIDWDMSKLLLHTKEDMIPMPKDHFQQEQEFTKRVVKVVEQRMSTERMKLAAYVSRMIGAGLSAFEIRDKLKEYVHKLEKK